MQTKRVYEIYDTKDGYRVLVDRLWPRGMSKEKAHVDIWLKEIAPSDTLRNLFHHEGMKWAVFEEKYKEELEDKKELLLELKKWEKQHSCITLLYGAKDTNQNQAIVLLHLLQTL